MTIEQLKTQIMSGQQHYFHRDDVVKLLEKLNIEKSKVLTLFDL